MEHQTQTAALTSRGGQAWGASFLKGFVPRERNKVSDWALKYRRLSAEGSPQPGPWTHHKMPWSVEIMDTMCPTSDVREIVLMKSAQVGGTELAINFLFRNIHQEPAPTMYMLPTVELAGDFSKEALQPSIDTTDVLNEVVADSKGRDSSNSQRYKSFAGGYLVLAGANSAAALRRRSIRYLILDDIDDFPADLNGQGDPAKLADKRTTAFTGREKKIRISTPTIKGHSRIEKAYLASDQRRFVMPCPHCGNEQHFEWPQVQFDTDNPADAVYVCKENGCLIEHRDKDAMMQAGRWVAQNPGPNRPVGFHISELYSSFRSWGDIAKDFMASKDDPSQLKVFVNLVLGETWEDRGEAPDHERLKERAGGYRLGYVPKQALFVTAAVDVQADRLEVELKAWGENRVSWSIGHHVLPGDPSTDAPWDDLDRVIYSPAPCEGGGSLPIDLTAVDTGFMATRVYEWARNKPKVMLYKGASTRQAQTLRVTKVRDYSFNGAPRKGGQPLCTVDTFDLKETFYHDLRKRKPAAGEVPPDGYCFYPDEYPMEWFLQLTAEYLAETPHKKTGRIKREWIKTRPRNEALDLHVMNWAAAIRLNMNKWKPAAWQQLKERRQAQSQLQEQQALFDDAGAPAPPRNMMAPPPKPKAQARKKTQPRPIGGRSIW